MILSFNVFTDALSRVSDTNKGMIFALPMPHFTFITELKGELADNPEFLTLKWNLPEHPTNHPSFTYSDGLILHNGCI